MQILKFLSRFLICVLCVFCINSTSFAAGNIPHGDVGEYGNWLTNENVEKFVNNASGDMQKFQNNFQNEIQSDKFVPIEAKIGLTFMRALSSIDYVLQISLVRFTIIFLFIMYAFWIALEAYKMSRDSDDYKKVLYDVFKKGFIIVVWVIILNYGPAKLFTMLISPILSLGTYLSNFILNAVAQMNNSNLPDTCAAIHDYVNANAETMIANNETVQLLIEPESAANIMCLPARISVFFYHATGAAWKWMINGFGHGATQIVMGAICMVIFIKCIFKYAFMTLGIVADLFLTLLMLPFTALAESMPSTSEKNYVGQIFNGFLKIFNTKKLSAVISVFVNAAIYFVSLAIIIAICASLLGYVFHGDYRATQEYETGRAMMTILCGCLVLYLANKAEKLAEQMGGSINNSFGKQLQSDAKTLWGDTKKVVGKIYKDWKDKK